MVENVFDPLDFSKQEKTRQKIAKSPSLTRVQERTRLRRGRAKDPTQIPLLTPDPAPTLPIDPIPAPISKPAPPPPPPKELFVTVGKEKFFSEKDFLAEQKTQSPCGDRAPFAFNHSEGIAYCSYNDFLDAGFKLPTAPPKDKRRGKLCPKGETYWGGKCKEVSFSEATFF